MGSFTVSHMHMFEFHGGSTIINCISGEMDVIRSQLVPSVMYWLKTGFKVLGSSFNGYVDIFCLQAIMVHMSTEQNECYEP